MRWVIKENREGRIRYKRITIETVECRGHIIIVSTDTILNRSYMRIGDDMSLPPTDPAITAPSPDCITVGRGGDDTQTH